MIHPDASIEECMEEISALEAEVERLQSCLYAQEAVKPLYDEIKKLRAASDAAFFAMCNHRDTPDEELFQNAIDDLGMALGGKVE